MRIRDQKGVVSGAIYTFLGLFTIAASLSYPVGTAARMGPGFFPLGLGALLTLLGLSVLLRAAAIGPTSHIERMDWPSGLWIAGSIGLFALTLQSLGFIVSVSLLVLASSAASLDRNWRAAAVSAVALTLLTLAIFVIGLGVRLPIWPTFLM